MRKTKLQRVTAMVIILSLLAIVVPAVLRVLKAG